MRPRPDILWIVTTQWRAQAHGFAGDRNARTPRLDALARQAGIYTQAVTPHPFGPFARAALLTGVPSPANGVRDYFDPLPRTARTIAHALNERDYATAFFGKWHLSPRDPAWPLVGEAHARLTVAPEDRGGFRHWEGFEGGFVLNDPWLHGTTLPEPRRFRGYQSDVIGQRAANWIGDHSRASHKGPAARPWFALVSVEPPHPPYDESASGFDPVDLADILLNPNVPRDGAAEAQARRELAGYYRHIAATDRAAGELVAAVDVLAANSGRPVPIVVITSVHGDMHGAHGHFRKGWPHEESVRVPLLFRAPEQRPGICDGAISLLEVARLTLACADNESTPAPRPFSRISMPSVVALPQQCDRVWRGLRSPRRKLVLAADGSPWLFFDLERDPWELDNLVTEPSRRAELEQWREWARQEELPVPI